jgi:TolA-binding protein
MKIRPFVFCLLSALLLASPAQAKETTRFVESDSHSVFTGLFESVWARLRSINPQSQQSANTEIVYSAGIRGAESTDTLMKPYWKDDLTQNVAFQAELASFNEAQSRMDQGKLEDAISRFDDFLQQYGDSALRPNALFGKSISLAGIGEQAESLATMRQFVDENPSHPLVDDAMKVIDSLN